MSADARIPERNPRTATRVIAGKGVVVVIDARELHTLNPVGTRVWELCDGRDVDAIAQAIAAEYAIDAETAAADVVRFVDKLVAAGAMRWGTP